MTIEVDEALDLAREELNNVMARQRRYEIDTEALNVKLSKLKAMQRQGVQQLRNLRGSEIALLSEFATVKNLVASADLEIQNTNYQLAETFKKLAQNHLDLVCVERTIKELAAIQAESSKPKSVILFKNNDVKGTK